MSEDDTALSSVGMPNRAPDSPGEPDTSSSLERRGAIIWLTGLPGAGKSTLAAALGAELVARGWHTVGIDGDEVRRGLCADLGFDRADRSENVRRVTEAAILAARSGASASSR